MEDSSPHIQRIKADIERHLGRKMESPVDFDFLSLKIKESVGDSISVSTLKRIWGYVTYKSTPSKSVLSILARFVGFPHWEAYCMGENASDYTESRDLTESTVNAGDLNIGDVIEMEWKPNRYCKVECVGTKRFKVLESRNSKLFPGNVFHADVFAQGLPFYVTDLQQNFSEGRIYVAGEYHGLTSVKVKKQK